MVICKKCSHQMEYIGVDTIKRKYDMYKCPNCGDLDTKLKKELCPFCDKEMIQTDVRKENRIDALVYYECECGWKDLNLIDTRKVDIYKLNKKEIEK